MATPKISIIVPVYNVERYLRQCIDSILAQTYKDFELLLIDDGSPDNSGNICDEYAQKDPRIRVFHKPNGGVSSARNMGIDNARGEYISFIDADDYVEPNFLEEMVKAMEKLDADLVCCGVRINERDDGSISGFSCPDREKVYDKKEGLIEMFSMDSFYGWPWNKLYKTDIVKKKGLRFPEGMKYCEDRTFVVNYSVHCSKISYISSALYHYVYNEISAVRKPSTKKKYESQYLDRLEADKRNYNAVKNLHDNEIMKVLKARLFITNNTTANVFLSYYDGTDKKTLLVLRKNFTRYLPYYLRRPKRFKSVGKKEVLRVFFRIFFPTLYNQLKRIVKR